MSRCVSATHDGIAVVKATVLLEIPGALKGTTVTGEYCDECANPMLTDGFARQIAILP